jgi:hypothetical protein
MRQVAREAATTREEARLDESIAEAMAPLRLLEPDEELRMKNRRRLSAALIEQERARLSPKLPLWRRTLTLRVSVLVLLLALALTAGLALAWVLNWWGTPATPEPAGGPVAAVAAPADAMPACKVT